MKRRLEQLDAGEKLANATAAALMTTVAASRSPAEVVALADWVDVRAFDEANSTLAGGVGNALIYAGALGRAARMYDGTIAAAARRGSRMTVAWQSCMRADASLRLGEARRAEAEARTSMEYFEVGSGEPGLAWTTALLANVLRVRGALDEAEERLGRGVIVSGAPPTFPHAMLLTARANLHLARGRPSAALRDAAAAGVAVSPSIPNPMCSGWRSAAALALAALDRGDEALEMAEDELGDARRLGIAEAEGAALRTLGLVTGGADGLEALRASVSTLERSEGVLEHAHSLLELGAALQARRGAQRGA